MEAVFCVNCQTLQRQVHDLKTENDRLRRQLADALRAGKRQAGSFSKGDPKPHPKNPGRKPGKDYGTKAHRQPPAPEQIDEVHEAEGGNILVMTPEVVQDWAKKGALVERDGVCYLQDEMRCR